MRQSKTAPPALMRVGLITSLCLGLAACGGSDSDAPRYPDDPPARVAPTLADLTLPPTVPLGTLTPAAARERANAGSGLAPISTADPATVLGGGAIANNMQPPGKNFTRVPGLEGRPLPTGKWYKGFFYQSPRNLADNFDQGGDAREQSVFAFPHQLWLDDRIDLVTVAFPRRRFIDPGDTAKLNNFSNPYVVDDYLFNVQPDARADLFLTHAELSSGRLTRRIDQSDELTVTTSWNGPASGSEPAPKMQLIAAVGSPYVTVKYRNLRPRIGVGQSIHAQGQRDALNQPIAGKDADPTKWEADGGLQAVSVDGAAAQPFLEGGNDRKTPDLKGKKFRFVYAMPDNAFKDAQGITQYAQRVMVVYASQTLTLKWDAPTRTYTADAAFTGVLRAAFVDDERQAGAPAPTAVAYADREAVLDAHANEYPVNSSLQLQYTGSNATVTYNWVTETLDGSPATGSKLLMMAFDATHLKSMPSAKRVGLTYRSNFGQMTGVEGPSWTQTLAVPAILGESSNPELLWHGNGTIKASDKAAILKSLKDDATIMKNYITNCNYESYLCGKYVSNIARMVLIADQMETEEGARELRADLLDFLKRNLNPWFDGKDDADCRVNKAVATEGRPTPVITCEGPGEGYKARIAAGMADYFRYDTVNGGTVTQRPFAKNDVEQDFYNAIYTDHMFHYGYFIYAAAVVARYDADWLKTYREPVNTLVRDIANASLDDKHYPITRTYDWFRLQNIADAGPAANGGNTESSSEAINSGYGLVLWGAASGNSQLQALASVMLAGEIRTAQAYYQVTPANNVFTEVQAITVPIVGGPMPSLSLDPATLVTWGIKRMNLTESQVFFGPRRVFRVGIQLLPFSPISEYVISPEWARLHASELLAHEQSETALYEEIFTGDPSKLRCGIVPVDPKDPLRMMPVAACAGKARTLYGWRQLLTSVNGLNDPTGAYARHLGYMDKVAQQTATFAKNSVGVAFRYTSDVTGKVVEGTQAEPGVDPDILKDVSVPSNNSNVLWWLSTRKP